ncbi:Inositol 1,4,5-trisphosphate receptor-interacting protein-like 2 [Quillaja saponaria]|uniref:Inositol 1,4,5-trisphosphate receptor-interacting protein-like 2 n=1 Tax=Quillaja saponaria TaxID=32244 RepID=A0AAD7L8V4_QUISA|nr:Inositol 1,4,5-trisphosphate receptor-interacting protein-like 2 [Quillaja saponaria]
MAFMIPKSNASFSETEKVNMRSHSEDKDSESLGPITSQLYLKSSSAKYASSQTLDKQVVLRRLRHHKSLNKVRSPFQALFSSSKANTASSAIQDQKWLQQDDAFSAP